MGSLLEATVAEQVPGYRLLGCSAVVDVDAQGNATVSFDFPDNITKWICRGPGSLRGCSGRLCPGRRP